MCDYQWILDLREQCVAKNVPSPKTIKQNDCSHFDYFGDASRNTQIQMAYIRNSIKFVGVIHSKCASGYVDVKEAGAPTRFPSFHFIS